MTKTELAKMLDDISYIKLLNGSDVIMQKAKENGLVVVFGYSDDNMEMDGAVRNEFGCYNGRKFFFDKNLNEIEEKDAESDSLYIEALWCKEEYDWTYETNIPDIVEFDVLDDDYKFCRGFVFALDDASQKD